MSDKSICSFMTLFELMSTWFREGTLSLQTSLFPYKYPNPVAKNYDGPITIDGLDYESTVHVTDASGRLVAKVESMGGRAVWDGRFDSGLLAPYGVYLVFAVDGDGKTSGTTKLAITR